MYGRRRIPLLCAENLPKNFEVRNKQMCRSPHHPPTPPPPPLHQLFQDIRDLRCWRRTVCCFVLFCILLVREVGDVRSSMGHGYPYTVFGKLTREFGDRKKSGALISFFLGLARLSISRLATDRIIINILFTPLLSTRSQEIVSRALYESTHPNY